MSGTCTQRRLGRLGRAGSCGADRKGPRRPAGRLASWVLVLLGLFGPACTSKNLRADLDRSSIGDEDLLALLPRGLDAVLDVDMAGLRRLDSAAELLSYLPAQSLSHLEKVIDLPLRNLDGLAVGFRSAGTRERDVVVVVRGHLERERIARGLRALGETRAVEYHGVPLIEMEGASSAGDAESDGLAAALLTPRTAVLANRLAVRQVIDIYRGVDDGARQQGDLMAALGRAPRAKVGRPAVLMAALVTPPVRDRLRAADVSELGADAQYIAAAIAVGDGVDLGVVAAYRELSAAKDVATRLLDRAQELRHRPALTFIGIERYIQPLIAIAAAPAPQKGRHSPELHIAYRLSSDDLNELLSRIGKLQRLRDRLSGG